VEMQTIGKPPSLGRAADLHAGSQRYARVWLLLIFSEKCPHCVLDTEIRSYGFRNYEVKFVALLGPHFVLIEYVSE